MAQAVLDTPIGPLFVETTARGVSILAFVHDDHHFVDRMSLDSQREDPAAEAVIEQVRTEVDEYFRGERTRFDVSLDVKGTPFQQRVWQSIAAVPFGEIASYSEVA